MENVFHAKANSPEKKEAELLVLLIEKYDDEHYSIESPHPIEVITFRMEQMRYKQKDLEGVLGCKNVSQAQNSITKK